MALVYGILGMSDYKGKISFNPRLTSTQKNGRVNLIIQEQRLSVSLDQKKEETVYLLKEGTGLTITHQGEKIALKQGAPVSMKIDVGPSEAR
jgi:trehalose/maltose hydrolase-like predicted phosphorylase